MAKNELYLS